MNTNINQLPLTSQDWIIRAPYVKKLEEYNSSSMIADNMI